MNLTDILLLLVVVLSIWVSIQRGLIISLLELLVWVGSLIIGFLVYAPLSGFLLKVAPSLGIWATPLSFIVAVVVVRLLLALLANRIIEDVPAQVHANPVNKFLGIIPGLINGVIWAALLAAFLMLLPFNNSFSQQSRESRLGDKLVSGVSWMEDKLSPVFGSALSHAAPKITAEVSEEKSVKLPYTVKSPKVRNDLEAEMLALVNKERTSRGLGPLKADPEMAVVARKHSVDMFARGYFSHYTPEGADPFDRMKEQKVRFITAGENLALAQTLTIAHTGLMNSPGHKANILNPAYGRVGIGILDGGIYGLMITQNFRN